MNIDWPGWEQIWTSGPTPSHLDRQSGAFLCDYPEATAALLQSAPERYVAIGYAGLSRDRVERALVDEIANPWLRRATLAALHLTHQWFPGTRAERTEERRRRRKALRDLIGRVPDIAARWDGLADRMDPDGEP